MKKKRKKIFSHAIHSDIVELLENYSDSQNRSRSYMAEMAIVEFLERRGVNLMHRDSKHVQQLNLLENNE